MLVGKGDAHNDALTFGTGEPRDFWMHVAGCPGSHVVVKNPDDLPELPRDVLEAAAALAAWHSKARGARGKVEVHVCRVADVSKPRGFARERCFSADGTRFASTRATSRRTSPLRLRDPAGSG